MDESGLSSALVFDLELDSPFSFKCQVCGACCSNKAISIGPYEAVRLAEHIGLTPAEFYRQYTEERTRILRHKSDGSCIFLSTEGCGVYANRPLVCRLFPLGQLADERGQERYGSMPLHPDCLGLLGTDGTVSSYLGSQGAGPYLENEAP
jgi:Fe-S-cluster containining protein